MRWMPSQTDVARAGVGWCYEEGSAVEQHGNVLETLFCPNAVSTTLSRGATDEAGAEVYRPICFLGPCLKSLLRRLLRAQKEAESNA